MYVATLAWLSIAYGYARRFDRSIHIPFVLTGITIDILLVLVLEISRHAVETAFEFKLNPLQQFHILFSTIALLCYFPTLYFGFKLARGEKSPGLKKKHIKIATTTLIFRTLGFIFMFSMWKD